MNKVLTELCGELNNYFWREKIVGEFVIKDGQIHLIAPKLQDGQYFRIIGSVFNDGVHQYPANDLTDEEFNGGVWSMAVPQAVIDLAADIQSWQDKYCTIDSQAMSPFASESFGNYSYSKGTASGSASGGGNPNSWQSVFASRINKWRRMRGVP